MSSKQAKESSLILAIAINSMFLWAQNTSMPYGGFKTGRSLQLKIEDAQYLYNRVPELQYIAPRNARGIFGSAAPSVVRKNKGGGGQLTHVFENFHTSKTLKKQHVKSFILLVQMLKK